MKVIWSPLAIDRVGEIAEYIANDNPNAAEKWILKIFTQTERLGDFPQSGNNIKETPRKNIRELISGNYRIIYRVELRQVSILTVRNMKQILPPVDLE